jgi:hypothetical protein
MESLMIDLNQELASLLHHGWSINKANHTFLKKILEK